MYQCCSDHPNFSSLTPSLIQSKNLTGLEWMEGMSNVKWDGSVGDETEKEIVFIDLPLMITMLLDLPALKIRLAYFSAVVQQESIVFAPQIVEDVMFRSSMKAVIGENEIFWWNYSEMATKVFLELCSCLPKDRVKQAKILQ